MTSNKPVIEWAVIIVAGLVGLSSLLTSVSSVAVIGQRPIQEVVGTGLLSLIVAAISVVAIQGTWRGTFGSRLPVSLYLWGILVVYLYNVLRTFGWYLPGPQLSDEELVGAAFFELTRYVVLIVLIVWVALSKSLKAYFAQPVPDVASVRADGDPSKRARRMCVI